MATNQAQHLLDRIKTLEATNLLTLEYVEWRIAELKAAELPGLVEGLMVTVAYLATLLWVSIATIDIILH